ncbi:hypothetical protein FRC16_003463 [Serendipita sp. 398]|nr:hypothetical protein FRC16_003463 [Serendipita sp. 398]
MSQTLISDVSNTSTIQQRRGVQRPEAPQPGATQTSLMGHSHMKATLTGVINDIGDENSLTIEGILRQHGKEYRMEPARAHTNPKLKDSESFISQPGVMIPPSSTMDESSEA